MKKISTVVPFLCILLIGTMFAGCGSSNNPAPAALSVSTATLPDGTIGVAYSQTLIANGGTSPYTWAVTVGALPAGLTLAGATGVISGTPTTAATSTFTVTVTDASSATASQSLSITVAAAGVDTTPDPFSFTSQADVALSTLITSNTITVAGINSPSSISVSGGSYSINGGAFTSVAGTVTNGQTVAVQHTSSASNSTVTTTTLTIGGVSASFGSTTVAAAGADTTPDPFSFTAQTGVALSTVITSTTITVAGINSPAPISVTGGAYSINGGAFTTAAGTVTNGQTVAVQHTSSASNSTVTTTTLTIGGVSASFTSTTVAAAVDAAALYLSQCSGCHSLGAVDGTGSPNLSGVTTVPANFTAGVATGHNGASITLSAAQIAALSAYVQAN